MLLSKNGWKIVLVALAVIVAIAQTDYIEYLTGEKKLIK